MQCSKVQWSTGPCSLERSRINCRAASCLLTASGHWKIGHFLSYLLNIFSLLSNVIYLSKHSVSTNTVTGHASDIYYLLNHYTCTATDRSVLSKGSLLYPLFTQRLFFLKIYLWELSSGRRRLINSNAVKSYETGWTVTLFYKNFKKFMKKGFTTMQIVV